MAAASANESATSARSSDSIALGVSAMAGQAMAEGASSGSMSSPLSQYWRPPWASWAKMAVPWALTASTPARNMSG